MRKYYLLFIYSLFIFSGNISICQVKLSSWNIRHLGNSKSNQAITFMAKTLKEYDIVAIQEVVAGDGGAQAVAKLADELNRTGFKWNYVVSNPTQGGSYSSERYAYLWKPSRVKLMKKAWLDLDCVEDFEREPYFIKFKYKEDYFTLVNIHALPKSKQPEQELKNLKLYPDLYFEENLIFLGDFNLPQSHTVFNPLKSKGFIPALVNQKTTLKMKCVSNECLASEYDNIFLDSKHFKMLQNGVNSFYKSFPNLKSARAISDHIPVWVEFDFK
ncbi:MAG: endonuclease/exonuclease/phosphatase family protein [Psychroflexus sp.]